MHSTYSHKPIITLTTDFSLQDEYVGILKGVLLSHCPYLQIVDITHSIQPQNILSAALTINNSYHYFPKGSIHVVVVDPGVGSLRSILALRADNHLFIAPNNGVLTPLLTSNRFMEAFSVENKNLFLKTVSRTFHGRDIMAPVAARLACGMRLNEVGPSIEMANCLRLQLPKVKKGEGIITGEVVAIDAFGNLQTSITRHDLATLQSNAKLIITFGQHTIHGLSSFYSEVEPGTFLALLDSRNHLEIAIHRGNAASMIHGQTGIPVTISCQ